MAKPALQQHPVDGLPFRVSLESVNRGVGLVAFTLPFALLAVWFLGGTCAGIDSISHYYYTRLGGDLLVGALCFIGTLLLFFYKLPAAPEGGTAAVDGYLGHGTLDIWAARFAGICAFGVALAPTSGTGCEDFSGGVARVFLQGATGGELALPITGTASFDFWATLGLEGGLLTYTHYASALGMFVVLAYFSLVVFARPQTAVPVGADSRQAARKQKRNLIYRVCGGLIVVAIVSLAYKALVHEEGSPGLESWNKANLTFWFEALGLVAFGVSWSLKGRLFGLFRDPEDEVPSQGL
ncbi:MAG: hypothetical protein JNK19_17340 [Tabrizicola sp.]|nr:hypothetical protein [Tabrizicola sp.]